jgi:hypothetical protein
MNEEEAKIAQQKLDEEHRRAHDEPTTAELRVREEALRIFSWEIGRDPRK